MDLVYPHRAGMRDVEVEVLGTKHLPQGAAVASGEGDDDEVARLRGPGRLDDVLRVAGRRDGEQHVARVAERFDLLGEHAVEIVVVGDGGERRGVGSERYRGQPRALALEAAHQLRGEVLRVGRRAAVAAGERLLSRLERLREGFARARELGRHRLRPPAPELDALLEMLLQMRCVVHYRLSPLPGPSLGPMTADERR